MNKWTQITIYGAFVTFLSCAGKAATYMECTSKDIKTCTKEVTKGAALKGLMLQNGKKYIKIEFQTVNDKKGTLVKETE